MKKFLSLLLAMIMVFSLSVAVFATDDGYVESPGRTPVEPEPNVALIVGIVIASVVVVGAIVAGVVIYTKKKK